MRPADIFNDLKEKLVQAVADTFPVYGKSRVIEARRIWIDDNKKDNDFPSQKQARLKEKSWTVPLKAELVVRDRDTGNIVAKKTVTLAQVPKMTGTYGFIIGGKEYQLTNQLLLKPGIYNRIRKDGSLASEYHIHGRAFDIKFDPATRRFSVQAGSASPDLYPILKVLGVSDEELEKRWGKEILEANKKYRRSSLRQFAKSITGRTPTSDEEAAEMIKTRLEQVRLDPTVTKVTMGQPIDKPDKNALLRSTEELLKLSRGEREPDNRELLAFKRIRAPGDIVADAVRESSRKAVWKIRNNLDRTTNIEQIVPKSAFDSPIRSVFTNSQLSSFPEQVNPLDAYIGATRTTVMGEGGISSVHAITDELKRIDPSHLGFLDPLHTPEDSKAGVTLTMTEGARLDKGAVKSLMWNIKEKRFQLVAPEDLLGKKIVFPDQVRIVKSGGKIRVEPKSSLVEVHDSRKGPLDKKAKWDSADYALIDAVQLYSPTTNLIPFLSTVQPVRATMATRQMTQALPLKYREPPKVQVSMTSGLLRETSEKHFGEMWSVRSETSGTVAKITDDYIEVKDDETGKKVRHPIPKDMPLNGDKYFLDSEPVVKVGDKVKKGQLLADTNFTKGGDLAIGTNLRVAYLPFKGLTFEDAVVVSESAAKKLTSVHLHRDTVDVGKEGKLSKKGFQAYYGNLLSKENADKLDEDGVIKPGQRVKPGDILVAGLKKAQPTTETEMLKRLHKSLVKPYQPELAVWDKDSEGVVTHVVKSGNKVRVYVKTERPLQVADKIVGRYANKGVVSAIIPDHEMPRTKDGRPVDVIMNPIGVPARINIGQVLETAASKIADKTGKPVTMPAFPINDERFIDVIRKELKKHGLSDKEPVYDPKTGKKLGDVLVGDQYILKLKHIVEAKSTARSGGIGYQYDANNIPKGGGPEGAKSIGNLGVYAMLAHGLTKNLQEMHTWKADREQAEQLWTAVQKGQPLPAPKPSFAYKKFLELLKAAGINVRKEGNALVLSPMTDEDILSMSAGKIQDPGRMVFAKDPTKPEKGGLFDPDVTGGIGGKNWAHIELPEPLPNPVFEKAVKSLLGLTSSQYEDLVSGKIGVDQHGNIVDDPDKAKYVGGRAVQFLLKRIDVDKEIKELRSKIQSLRGNELDKANKKLKYLEALKRNNLSPDKAYLNKYIPVLPPVFRPLRVDKDGNIVRDDINEMYKGVGLISRQFSQLKGKLPESELVSLRKDLYDAFRAYTGVGVHPSLQYKGILNIVEGKTPKGKTLSGAPKFGFFQKNLIGPRQDMSMYSTITPNPELSIDEVGLPKSLALKLFEPFVVAKIRQMKEVSPLEAKKLIKAQDPLALSALEQVTKERPVLLKRDPVLHRYGVMAFKPRLVSGKTIQIHPLVTGPFNADFDGNCITGESKIVLTVRDRDAIVAMQKGGSAMIDPNTSLDVLDSGMLMEISIKDMPIMSDQPVKYDRNGNPVYAVDPEKYAVLSYDPSTGKTGFFPVIGLTVEENAPVARVSTGKHEVRVSTNESLCVYDSHSGEVMKKAPSECLGACVPVVRGIPEPPYKLFDWDFDVGWMIGAFVSDGWVQGKGIGYSKVSPEHRDRFVQALRKIGASGRLGVRVYEDYHDQGKGDAISGRSVKIHIKNLGDVVQYFEDCYDPDAPKEGRRALAKTLPWYLDYVSQDCLWGVLSGLIDGDGSLSIDKRGRLSCAYHTSSPFLRDKLLKLTQRLGIRATATKYGPKAGRTQTHDAWIISFSAVDIAEALVNGNLRLVSYKKEVKEIREKYYQHGFNDDRDIVPIPEVVISRLASSKSAMPPSMRRSLATIKSRLKPHFRISRQLAEKILSIYSSQDVDPEAGPDFWESFTNWAERIVRARNVRWEVIKSVVPDGRETVYDLVVPDTKVFAVNGGLVVWDTMAAFVPISSEAVKEAYKALPSRNLFSVASGEVLYTPTKEMMTGIFLATMKGKRKNKSYKTVKDALAAVKRGEISFNDVVRIGGKQTTPALAKLEQVIPPDIWRKYASKPLDKNAQRSLYHDIAAKYPSKFSDILNEIKDLGNDYMYESGFSFGLDDFKPDDEVKRKYLKPAISQAAKAKSEEERVKIFDKAVTRGYIEAIKKKSKKPDNIYLLTLSGVKPGPEQHRQILVAPGLIKNPDGSINPKPVFRTYSEGLPMSDYWIASSGARQGIITKVQSVQDPGALTKMMMNTVLDQVITDTDCGGTDGISMDTSDSAVIHRVLAKPVKFGKKTIKAGTIITPEIAARLRSNGVKKVVVRTPMKCVHGNSTGLCSKCYGLYVSGKPVEPGENIGVTAAQSLGERAIQLTLKAFHSGGVVPMGGSGKKESLVDSMTRLEQILNVPKVLPNAAPLAKKDGVVEKISQDPAGGWRVTISGTEHYIPQRLGKPMLVSKGKKQSLRVGMRVSKGDALADGPINPHELLELKGMESVQRYLADELYNIYKPYNIDRRHVETVIGAMTNTAIVEDPGDVPGFVRGDPIRYTTAQYLNQQVTGRKMKVRPVLRGVNIAPFDLIQDWMALLNHQRLKDSIVEAAQQGWKTDLEGIHPIPPLVAGKEPKAGGK